MELRRYLSILRRHALLVLAIVIAAVGAGYLVAPKTHTYTATSTVYVSPSIDMSPASGDVSGNRVAGLDRLIGTFAAMATSNKVAADVIATTHADRSPARVANETTARQVPDTNLIKIAVTDRSAAMSSSLANGAADALLKQVGAFQTTAPTTATESAVSLYEAAQPPTIANRLPLKRDLALAGLLGLIVAGIVLALIEHLDITVRSAEDAERELDVPVLAVVPSLGRRLPLSPTAGTDERLPRAKESAGRTGSFQ
jgi:capsular polysaccharide biosynthesis protein